MAIAAVYEEHVAGCVGVAPVEAPTGLHKISVEVTVPIHIYQRRPTTHDLGQKRQGAGHVPGTMREVEPPLPRFVNKPGLVLSGVGIEAFVGCASCQMQ